MQGFPGLSKSGIFRLQGDKGQRSDSRCVALCCLIPQN